MTKVARPAIIKRFILSPPPGLCSDRVLRWLPQRTRSMETLTLNMKFRTRMPGFTSPRTRNPLAKLRTVVSFRHLFSNKPRFCRRKETTVLNFESVIFLPAKKNEFHGPRAGYGV